MKKHKGTISISRMHGNGVCIHISIVDELSGTEFFDGTMSVEDFGNAVTGASSQPVEFEFRPKAVGMKVEHKTELVPRPECHWRHSEKASKKALEPFEVDGWMARESDMRNHHNAAGKNQRVHFHRYVPA